MQTRTHFFRVLKIDVFLSRCKIDFVTNKLAIYIAHGKHLHYNYHELLQRYMIQGLTKIFEEITSELISHNFPQRQIYYKRNFCFVTL